MSCQVTYSLILNSQGAKLFHGSPKLSLVTMNDLEVVLPKLLVMFAHETVSSTPEVNKVHSFGNALAW